MVARNKYTFAEGQRVWCDSKTVTAFHIVLSAEVLETANMDRIPYREKTEMMFNLTKVQQFVSSAKTFNRQPSTEGYKEIEDVRPLKKRRFVGEEAIDTEKLFLKALHFQQDLVEFCRKILIEVTTIMLDVDNKGREIQMHLNSTGDLPVKKRSTSQEPSGWLQLSKREELHKLSSELSGNITDCNIKLENLRSSVESLNTNMSFLKKFFDMAENQEKTDDDLKHLEGRKDVSCPPWTTPHEEHPLVTGVVVSMLVELSNKMHNIDSDLNKLTETTVTMKSEIGTTMTALRRSINGNFTPDLHRQTNNKCPNSSRRQSTDDTENPIVKRPKTSISNTHLDFLQVESKDVTITIQGNSSTHTSTESKPIIIPRETYDKLKRNSATAFARKLLPFFFNKNELESCNFNTLQEEMGKAKLATLLEIVESEFPESTVGAEAMKKIRDGINSCCRSYKEKSKPSNSSQ